jgi:hypothetical protein
MKIWWIAAPLCLGTLTFAALAQDPSPERAPGRLAPVTSPQQELESQWRQRLSDPDLEQRLGHYEALKAKLAEQPQLRDMLQRFQSEGGELAWTARLLLRESQPSSWRQRARSGFEELERRMQELERSFGDFDRMFGNWQPPRWLDDWQPGLPPTMPNTPGLPPTMPNTNESRSDSMRIQTTPDGVEVEIRTQKNGKEEVQQFKARSLEELYEQHPELKERMNGVRIDVRGPSLTPLAPKSRAPAELRTDVLGVYSQKLEPDTASELGINPEQGLYIERVEPGTIAQVIGLMRGDVLIEINGQAIYSVEDVRRILKERAPDEALELRIMNEGSSERRTLRWKPSELQKPEESKGQAQPKPLKKV